MRSFSPTSKLLPIPHCNVVTSAPSFTTCCRACLTADAELRKVWELLEEKYKMPAN
jgi:hypothetical protein